MKNSEAPSAAVIGHPVQHSLSPAIFRRIVAMEKAPLAYSKFEVPSEYLQKFIQALQRDQKLVGVNVTIPHKEAIIPLLTNISPEATAIGAVNVVKVEKDGLFGFNTDVIGIDSTFHKMEFDPSGKNALVWGAGGSAKAVCYALGRAGASQVLIFNPRSSRGQDLIEKFSVLFPKTKFKNVESVSSVKESLSIVINTTPVGMHSAKTVSVEDQDSRKTDATQFFSELKSLTFLPGAVAFDLIYTPQRTPFLKLAQSLGLKPVNGLGMLIDQALATWEIWRKPLKDTPKLHDDLRVYLQGILNLRENRKPIFLTGFMGVGKSAVAEGIARVTGRTALDTDRLVEETANLSISEIFKEKGEAEFRKLEAEAIVEAATEHNAVISLGGGALMHGASLGLVRSLGTLVYLSANEDVLEKRILAQNAERPLLAGLNAEERLKVIRNLMESRLPIYSKARIRIETDDKDVEAVVDAVISAVGGLDA